MKKAQKQKGKTIIKWIISKLGVVILLSLSVVSPVTAEITDICPQTEIQPRDETFDQRGIILTTFDGRNMWAYDVSRNVRYPLVETAPCNTHCNLSPDAEWITYFNTIRRSTDKMRLDGSERTPLIDYASEIAWWTEDTLLVWTPDHDAYLIPENNPDEITETFNVRQVFNLQPGGYLGLGLTFDGEDFFRVLIDTQDNTTTELGIDEVYFNAIAWSPDGARLAYVLRGEYDPTNRTETSEIHVMDMTTGDTIQITDLFESYGAVRINGNHRHELSWSPDGTRIAFWVIEMLGSNPEGINRQGVIHIVDVETGETTAYCGFATADHTPRPPRLVWSPDGTHLAFSADVEGNTGGQLLLVLDTDTGIFTELSNGVYATVPDVIAWGRLPG